LARLTGLLGTNNTESSSSGQYMSNTLSGVKIADGNLNFTPNQSQGGSVNITSSLSQNASQNKQEVQEVMEALSHLKQAIDQDDQMNPLVKDGAKGQREKLEAEFKKKEPDKSLVEHLVKTLQKGLEGVLTLAEPTMKVATLVAKAWGIPT
ncbi:MAG: hypothetical protein RLZZ29_1330, partial [Cyanobacteriota bacterium]